MTLLAVEGLQLQPAPNDTMGKRLWAPAEPKEYPVGPGLCRCGCPADSHIPSSDGPGIQWCACGACSYWEDAA